MQGLWHEAKKDADAMKEEIKLLKNRSMLADARAPQMPAAAPRYGDDQAGKADRDRNIVGKWAWIPSRAVRKQVSDIIVQYNSAEGIENDPQKHLTIASLETSQPKASYAFVKFLATDSRTAQDQGFQFRSFLKEQTIVAIGSEADATSLWSAQCRPEHERISRSILNQGRAWLHQVREQKLVLPKHYEWLGEDSEIIGGSYKEGKESITLRQRVVATLSEPAGVKTLHWNWEAVANIIGKDFATAKIHFTLEYIKDEKARRN